MVMPEWMKKLGKNIEETIDKTGELFTYSSDMRKKAQELDQNGYGTNTYIPQTPSTYSGDLVANQAKTVAQSHINKSTGISEQNRPNQGRDQTYGTQYNDKYTETTDEPVVMEGDAGKSSSGVTHWHMSKHPHVSMYLSPDQYHIVKENIKREAWEKRGEQWDDTYATIRLAQDYNIHLRFPSNVKADDDSTIDWNNLPQMPEGGLPQYNPERSFQKEKINMGNWELFKGAWNTEKEMQDAIDERARNLKETPWDALKNRSMNAAGSILQDVAEIHARRAHIDEQRDQIPGSTIGHLIQSDNPERKPWIIGDEMWKASRKDVEPRYRSQWDLYQQGAQIEKEHARNYQAIPGEYLNFATYEYGPDVIETIFLNSGKLLKGVQKVKSIEKYKKGVQLSSTIPDVKKVQIIARLEKEKTSIQNNINNIIKKGVNENSSFIDDAIRKIEKIYPPIQRAKKQGKFFLRNDYSEEEDMEEIDK